MARSDTALVFEQAYEESRYHGRFHHTVMSLYTTLFVGEGHRLFLFVLTMLVLCNALIFCGLPE